MINETNQKINFDFFNDIDIVRNDVKLFYNIVFEQSHEFISTYFNTI